MLGFHHDKNRVDNDAHTAEAAGAKPKDSGPDFTFVKTVQS